MTKVTKTWTKNSLTVTYEKINEGYGYYYMVKANKHFSIVLATQKKAMEIVKKLLNGENVLAYWTFTTEDRTYRKNTRYFVYYNTKKDYYTFHISYNGGELIEIACSSSVTTVGEAIDKLEKLMIEWK
jgi:uncharacterized protein (UPF0333 family)